MRHILSPFLWALWLAIAAYTHAGPMMMASAIGMLAIELIESYDDIMETEHAKALLATLAGTNLMLLYLGGWHFVDRLDAELNACAATHWMWGFFLAGVEWISLVDTLACAALSIYPLIAMCHIALRGTKLPHRP